MEDQSSIVLSVEYGLATIRLNRADQGNALNLATAQALATASRNAADDPAVRCVLLTGTGRFFCVGGDVGSFHEAGDDVSKLLQDITHHLNTAIETLADMDKPLVVAVNGPAAGAGLGLSLLGDIVIAAASAHFTMAYTAIGLTPDGGTSLLLPRLVGLRTAQDMAFTNRRIRSDEALAMSLVTRVVEDEALASTAHEIAADLARGPSRAYAAVRKLLRSAYHADLSAQLADEARAISSAAGTIDGQEGISAFLSKRPAIFTGN